MFFKFYGVFVKSEFVVVEQFKPLNVTDIKV